MPNVARQLFIKCHISRTEKTRCGVVAALEFCEMKAMSSVSELRDAVRGNILVKQQNSPGLEERGQMSQDETSE